MEMKDKRTKVVVCVLALAVLSGILTLATAGNLEPDAPPAPTMKTLNEIYDAVSGVSQREGCLQQVNVDASSTYTLFTVPTGKRFVLLNLTFRYDSSKRRAYLTVNDNFLTGYPYVRSYTESITNYMQSYADFPDRCVVVNAGETLKVVNEESATLKAMIVGYYYNIP
ncbi:MAG: hypothetical protein PHQ35_00285 [Phycisphaerae bacterium]|nr:hypothetical protein [Phycisphaerae bacterium]MDD5381665.1 hypothetical protein [Phycisphaerae bacterium]